MRPLFFAALAAFLLSCSARGQHFYPPLPSAKSAVDFDNHGFLINGKRTWISSAGIEYARVPHELWRDRLLKIKRAGFNCVEIYAFWNYHEISPGQWDFTGDKDVGAFLDLAHELGLYVTVRVGPYVCAEWEDGGFPLWLRFTPGLRVRQNEPKYLADVDGWYDHILPIVAARQISRGGGVIMVQLENEDDEGWGAWDLDPVKQAYFKHLLDKARDKGIDVLTFFSGMNHGGDPAPEKPIKSADQKDPWYTTEYWSGWYSDYGPMPPDKLTHYDRAAWRFLENGANGFNVYMFHGGTNFDHWNNNETAASYDYAGAIGQAGDLRPLYYKYKRIAMFAHSFQDILENCEDTSAAHANDYPGLTVRARTGPAGTVLFLDNPSDKPVTATFPSHLVLTVKPGEVLGLVSDFAIDENTTITSSEGRILGLVRNGDTTTLVLFNKPDDEGKIYVETHATAQLAVSAANLSGTAKYATAAKITFSGSPHALEPDVQMCHEGSHTLRVISVSEELADDTYFVEGKGGTYVVVGAPYVGEFSTPEDLPSAVQLPLDAKQQPRMWVYGPDNSAKEFPAKDLPPIETTAPTLTNWQSAVAATESMPGYDDSSWKKSDVPQPMGADGDGSPFAWYRTTIHADAAGTQYLKIPFIGDQAQIYLNGQRVNGNFLQGTASTPLDLKSGDNTLAFFVSHNGRTKLISTYGSVEHLDAKGLVGPIRLVPVNSPLIPVTDCVSKDWWSGQPPVEQLIGADVDTSKWDKRSFRGDFSGTAIGSWRSPFVCVRAILPDIAGPKRVLHVGFFDEKASFYLNGQKIGGAYNSHFATSENEHLANDGPLDLSLDSAWKQGGPNILTVILENSHAQATIGLVSLSSGDAGIEVKGWRMRGDVAARDDKALMWHPAPVANAPKTPTYYRTTFTVAADYYRQAIPVLRLSTKGMSRGFAWLNGHNLGRYPEKLQVDGLWLPECWIKPGENELVVLDEEGSPIAPAHLWVEKEASRRFLSR